MNSGDVSVTSFRVDNFSVADSPAGQRWYTATVRYLVDLDREVSAPVGVILFADGIPVWGIRTPRPEETLSGVPIEAGAGIALMRDLIRGWLESGDLPYASTELPPYSLAWWHHLAGLLGHRIRVESLRPTLCENPAEDLETLYQVLVRPTDKGASQNIGHRATGSTRKKPVLSGP